MTPEKLRAAADNLDRFHERFITCFGRVEAREHSRVYIRGLLCGREEHKTCEAIALRFAVPGNGKSPGRREVQGMQNFITKSPWEYQGVQEKIQLTFAEDFMPSAATSAVGTVGVVDESGDEKSGTHSCGAGTQWFGRVGKTEVCQTGVFLLGVTPHGSALLDHQLFLPEDWAKDKKRRKKTGVPDHIRFRTKPQMAIDMYKRTVANGYVKFDWIAVDSLYGKSGEFLAELEALGQKYVAETSSRITFWTLDPATQIPPYCGEGPRPSKPRRDSVRSTTAIAADLPESAWQPVTLREGAKGPLVANFACVRVWSMRNRNAGPPVWLVFRRELGSQQVKCYVSNADEDTALETLALVIASRWYVEQFFEDAKQHLGMADYEARGWNSWHHHMSLVAMAHLYVTQVRRDLREDVPELSLDRAYKLLCDAMGHPTLTPEESRRLAEYHLHYNKQAHRSHRKSWLQRHPDLAAQLRL